ncbi:hypothetical protein EVAR_24185_1 [Eumeta japonica]|uniref:Uncharacterized protein n=1 Tax=Eumeta variegata TaxID=151549 RepID=A0A4C1W623_EUMVA|nr:hypothetical protein EVAR_24185_1 [Eumeta japonica]
MKFETQTQSKEDELQYTSCVKHFRVPLNERLSLSAQATCDRQGGNVRVLLNFITSWRAVVSVEVERLILKPGLHIEYAGVRRAHLRRRPSRVVRRGPGSPYALFGLLDMKNSFKNGGARADVQLAPLRPTAKCLNSENRNRAESKRTRRLYHTRRTRERRSSWECVAAYTFSKTKKYVISEELSRQRQNYVNAEGALAAAGAGAAIDSCIIPHYAPQLVVM